MLTDAPDYCRNSTSEKTMTMTQGKGRHIMSTIEYFKLQAKNLMRDWKTHQDGEFGYDYTPSFFDIGSLLDAFDEDETKFCLQRAQHLIAQLVGFKKWDELIHAREDKLRYAKTVFDGLKASKDLVTAYEEWQDYFYSNNIDGLDIGNQIFVAQNFFSLPIDEEYRDNPIQQQIDYLYGKLKTYIEPIIVAYEFLNPECGRIEVLADSSKLISDKLKESIRKSLNYARDQLYELNGLNHEYDLLIKRTINGENIQSEWLTSVTEGFENKSKCCFRKQVEKIIPGVINSFTELKQQLAPKSEIVSLLRNAFDEVIEQENEIAAEFKNILGLGKAKISIKKKGENTMTGKEIRKEYWKTVEKSIRRSVPESFGDSSLFPERSAFDGKLINGILQLTCIARIQNPTQISVGIYIKSNDGEKNERIYNFLKDEKIDEIRSRLPYKNVKIEQADGKGRQPDGKRLQYNLLVTADVSILDRENWDFCRDFHCEVAKALYNYVIVGLGSIIRAM